MLLIHHGPVEYVSTYERFGLAFARVWHDPAGHRPGLVLISEDPRNLGGSPFGCAEAISVNVCRKLGLDVETVWYLEHYAALPGHPGHPLGVDRYAAVLFGTNGQSPRRRVLDRIPRTRLDVERLAGGVLPPLTLSPQGIPIGGVR